MISVDEALERILGVFRRLGPEYVRLEDALGRVLAEPIVAQEDVPPFDNSAMDGYAVRSVDTVGATRACPVAFKVLCTLGAGSVAAMPVGQGEAIRIMTGAPMPTGADSVVRFEDTDEGDSSRQMDANSPELVRIFVEARPRENVRAAGEDVRNGDLVLQEGTPLRPSEVGTLAMLGRECVQVTRRPRVAVLATGDELVPLGQSLKPGKIRNSNEYSVSALVLKYGGIPIRLGIARDNTEDLTEHLQAGIQQGVDLFLTSAGVSVGQYDVVKDVLASMGHVEFWQVRIKPGKPLAFGFVGDVPLIGLPGNPVSAMVSFEQFARPALLRMQGQTRLRKPIIRARLEQDVKGGARREFKRAIVESREDGYHARLTGEQGSGILTSMVLANGLLVLPEGTGLVRAGEMAPVQMLDWPEVD